MEREDRIQQIHRYVENMKEIRLLSTPDLNTIENADDYGRILIENFSKIGRLAAENRGLIDSVTPFFTSEDELSDDMREATIQLINALVGNDSFEEVDVHMSELLDGLLIDKEIEQSTNENDRVISMAKKVKRDYFLVSSLTRYVNKEVEEIRRAAIENAKALSDYLAKDIFIRLNDDAKEAALHYSVMSALLYENNLYAMPLSWWEEALTILDRSDAILKDPFYREACPDFDWEVYEFRICFYGGFLAYSYIPESIAKRVYVFTERGLRILENTQNEDILAAVNPEQLKDLQNIAAVIAKIKPAREACDDLYTEYEKRDAADYSVTGINNNLDTPSLYLSMVKQTGLELTEKDYDRYSEFEESVVKYISSLSEMCHFAFQLSHVFQRGARSHVHGEILSLCFCGDSSPNLCALQHGGSICSLYDKASSELKPGIIYRLPGL